MASAGAAHKLRKGTEPIMNAAAGFCKAPKSFLDARGRPAIQ
jgi:hypothetical protein